VFFLGRKISSSSTQGFHTSTNTATEAVVLRELGTKELRPRGIGYPDPERTKAGNFDLGFLENGFKGPLHPGRLTWNTIMEVWFRSYSFLNG